MYSILIASIALIIITATICFTYYSVKRSQTTRHALKLRRTKQQIEDKMNELDSSLTNIKRDVSSLKLQQKGKFQ